MSDNLMDKVTALGERLKIGGTEVGQKLSAGVSSMSFKMKEFFYGPNQADMLVEEATAEMLDEPDWATNLELCDMINHDRINSFDLIRAIKKRLTLKSPRIQYLALVLLETVVQNCEKGFSEVAAERVLDEMVKLIDDPQTVVSVRNKAILLIEGWGELSNELRYLPVYEETYKSLRSRGIRFPGREYEGVLPIFTPPTSASESNASLAQQIQHEVPQESFSTEQTKEAFDAARNSVELLTTILSSSTEQHAFKDDLTATVVQQCLQSLNSVQRIIQTAGDNESLLFEALNLNDEIQKVLTKCEDMKKPTVIPSEPKPAVIPVVVEPDSPLAGIEDSLIRKPAGSQTGLQGRNSDDLMDDLDEMIFGKKAGGTSGSGHDRKKQQSPKDDLIFF